MEYREPLDEKQVRGALLHLRSLKGYLRTIDDSFPPRTASERHMLRRARRCLEHFANSARDRNGREMTRWSQRAEKEFLAYWQHRRGE